MLQSLPPLLSPGRQPSHWLRRTGLIGVLASSCLLANSQTSPPSPKPVLQEWGLFIQAYHHTQNPQVVEKTLAYVRATTPDDQKRLLSNNGGILGFYQTWLATHPDARPGFQQEISRVAGSVDWHRFLLTLTDPPYTTRPVGHGPSPQHNDYLWGCFFATGQAQYLDSLVMQCRFLNAPSAKASQRRVFYDTGRSAMWSLKSNARQDSTVATYLRNPLVRQHLTDLFTQYQQANP